MANITVVTPVGPMPWHTRWLAEACASVRAQTVPAAEHVLALDAADIADVDVQGARVVPLLWRVGVGAVNHAISAARTDWVLVLDSDDTLRPRCIEYLAAFIDANSQRYGPAFYIRYPMIMSDTGAMVPSGKCFHRQVWASVGGYPNADRLDVHFVRAILDAGRYPVVDCEHPQDGYYTVRQHADRWTNAQGTHDTREWVRVYGWQP